MNSNYAFRRPVALAILGLVIAAAAACAQTSSKERSIQPNALIKNEFIYEEAPFPSCHASTIAETSEGLIAAWFGGTDEGNADVGIWASRHDGNRWSAPVEIANGAQGDRKRRYPCWNPVLFQPKEGPLLLFYKVGPNPSRWWGMMLSSKDNGKTWSEARKLPEGMLGPIKNKPVQLADGTLLCPSSTEHAGWRIHLERTPDLGVTWTKSEPLNDAREFDAIQPAILFHPEGRMQLLCRSKQKRITECWSENSGQTWSPMKSTSLPNPNAGIDAVTLKDGRHVLVYNHTTRGRTPLNVALSNEGRIWTSCLELEDEPGEYSYPAVIQTRDELVHVTYTWKRQRIKHAIVDPKRLP